MRYFLDQNGRLYSYSGNYPREGDLEVFLPEPKYRRDRELFPLPKDWPKVKAFMCPTGEAYIAEERRTEGDRDISCRAPKYAISATYLKQDGSCYMSYRQQDPDDIEVPARLTGWHVWDREQERWVFELDLFLQDVRRKRSGLLQATDWTALGDVPLAEDAREAWRAYRQELRDLPSRVTDMAIPWPNPPALFAELGVFSS